MPCGCSSDDVVCPVSRAIRVLQEKWVLHIVHTLLGGPRGFNELGREVGGCNPTTLAQRLARLEELGLVRRSPECEAGGRSAYALSEAGEALRDVIDALRAWSASHLGEDGVAHGVTVEAPTARTASVPPAASAQPASAQAGSAQPASDAAPSRVAPHRPRLRANDERSEPRVLVPPPNLSNNG